MIENLFLFIGLNTSEKCRSSFFSKYMQCLPDMTYGVNEVECNPYRYKPGNLNFNFS